MLMKYIVAVLYWTSLTASFLGGGGGGGEGGEKASRHTQAQKELRQWLKHGAVKGGAQLWMSDNGDNAGDALVVKNLGISEMDGTKCSMNLVFFSKSGQ